MAIDFPTIYLLPTHLGSQERQDLERQIPTLTRNATEAEVVVGRVSRPERAVLELRHLGLVSQNPEDSELASSQKAKRMRFSRVGEPSVDDDFSTEDEIETFAGDPRSKNHAESLETVKVLKLAWVQDSIKVGKVMPTEKYLVFQGHKTAVRTETPETSLVSTLKGDDALRRAKADVFSSPTVSRPRSGSQGSWGKRRDHHHHQIKHTTLLEQTTSDDDMNASLPPIPDYLHTMYSCQRPSPVNPPNEAFITELKKIRTTRILEGDKIGVRAYSSSIATLVAYPYVLRGAQDVTRLPGCGPKIGALFREFKETGKVREAREAENNPRLATLELFYNIWGVGEVTAREFAKKGWRDLDDIVEFGWNVLTRVQQIGVKYYDEFLLRISRKECEAIANKILDCANKIHPGFHMVIVGSYRRGKAASGDVDVILSHPDEGATHDVITKIVNKLDENHFVTHTLLLTTTNSERGQEPVPWTGNRKGSGFDTLDKALVVWQDPEWTTGEDKNPNPHRRVDMIISPWKTVGCAVLGWSSGTTFQRDLRRYCKHERSLKFDSSGVRSCLDGTWKDLESGPDGRPAPDPLTAERRVFDRLGLEFRPPEERCTR